MFSGTRGAHIHHHQTCGKCLKNSNVVPAHCGGPPTCPKSARCTIMVADLDSRTPLSTNGHLVTDCNGQEMLLQCVNWPSHLDTMLPEGLQHLSLQQIATRIAQLGFNCVRLTYSIEMLSSENSMLTARTSFERLGLQVYIPMLELNNPDLLDLTVFEVFKRAVAALRDRGVMVILDNHTSKAGWVPSDGNGFWWDQYFNPEDWLAGVSFMSSTFRGAEWYNVVGFSVRNELYGNNCSIDKLPIWYDMMCCAASIVHSNHPAALVIVGGLWYHSDLRHVRTRALQSELGPSIQSKLMYEGHWYNNWYAGNSHQQVDDQIGFVVQPQQSCCAPLFLSEFGCNQVGFDMSSSDADYMFSVISYLQHPSRHGINWGLWVFNGDYYIREGVPGFVDSWGLMERDLSGVRSPDFMALLQLIMRQSDPAPSVVPHSPVLCNVPTNQLVVTEGEYQCTNGYHSKQEALVLVEEPQYSVLPKDTT